MNMKHIKDDYNRSIKLQCITCGGTDFEANDDKTYIKCNTCNREYLNGYDELVELNQENIEKSVQNIKSEVRDDIQNEINDMLKNIFNK